MPEGTDVWAPTVSSLTSYLSNFLGFMQLEIPGPSQPAVVLAMHEDSDASLRSSLEARVLRHPGARHVDFANPAAVAAWLSRRISMDVGF